MLKRYTLTDEDGNPLIDEDGYFLTTDEEGNEYPTIDADDASGESEAFGDVPLTWQNFQHAVADLFTIYPKRR